MTWIIETGDALDRLRTLPDASVQCCVTSPPYWGLRNYGHNGQIGLEDTPAEYVGRLVAVFEEVRRILHPSGVLFLNLGDGFIDKQLQGMPWRVAFALQDAGWFLRSDIIWHKPNPMPESVQGSQSFRHRVTIEEYERLSRLRNRSICPDENGSGDMSCLQASEVPGSETPVSAQREGTGNGTGAGRARGCQGKATPVQSVHPWSGKPSQIRIDGEGQDHASEGAQQIPADGKGKANGSSAASSHQERSTPIRSLEASEREIQQERRHESKAAAELRASQGGTGSRSAGNSRGLARNPEAAQEPLLLLQEAEGSHDRSRNPRVEGRTAREGKPRSSVPELQLEEEGQPDSALLVDCPGCPQCEATGGYITRLSAGRPTKSHEYVFLFTKKATYYYDAGAIAEPVAWPIERAGRKPGTEGKGVGNLGQPNFRSSASERQGESRNRRDVWTIATEPTPFAHFATMPTELVKPCILAGTSEHGCCVHCGTPFVRVVERTPMVITRSERTHEMGRTRSSGTMVPAPSSRINGWRQACSCANSSPIPCVVLDPFAGSGTTGLVASRLGRDFIGIELNAEYAALARERITSDAPLFNQVPA